MVEYEVQATSGVTVSSMGGGTPLHIGDTVRIQDMNFMDSNGDVGLFLSARVSELEISFTNPTNNKITFSNYVKLKSEVSDDLLDRMQSIIDQNTPYRSEIMTTNGIQFKNGTGTTDLSAHIFKGANIVETKADNYSWYKDGALVAETQEITVNAADVPEKAVYSYKAFIDEKVVGNLSVTLTNVNDGSDGAEGKSGTPGKVIQQDTEPTERFKDMLWKYTGTSPLKAQGITAQPNMTYVWNGTAWQIWFLNPANLQAVNAWITNAMIGKAAIDFAKINTATIENLSVVNANLGNVKAGKITNEFDYTGDDGKKYTGTTIYDSNRILMDYKIDNQGGMTLSLSPEGLFIKGNTGEAGGSYALDLTKEGLNINAGPLGSFNLTPGGLVFSSDTELTTLPLSGAVTASVQYIKKGGVVYITGSGNWGIFQIINRE
ncbi:hypothetical protein AAFF39_12205 [Lactococcus garvieae]